MSHHAPGPMMAVWPRVEIAKRNSKQRRYFVPCPDCGHRQWLRFEQLRWELGNPQTARDICESCSVPVTAFDIVKALRSGVPAIVEDINLRRPLGACPSNDDPTAKAPRRPIYTQILVK